MTATLMHAPLTCSLAARIAAAEGDVALDINYVNLRTKLFEDGSSLLDINPLGQVSTMILPAGELLTETATVLLWLQSQSTKQGFYRGPEDKDYFQLVRWLGFCATELHKQIFRVVFYPEATDEVKNKVRCLAPERFAVLNNHLADREFLLGDTFSAADAYLTWFFVLVKNAKLDASSYTHLHVYSERMLARPKIKALIESDRAKDLAMDQQIIPE
ncbi:glutathione S-transferase family protein [Cognaticolwellia mytili]|uniref:glutathione S-transferase family protein n=1 Tax=Cognaticolwellia mytili TaxID=1888913 RepID=UPI000A176EDF|nr:glutathione S-transferase family protein [Cognaticolwellia mytili]